MESRIQSRSTFGIPGRVLAKCQKARRDERNGFPFSAAMEWREADWIVCLYFLAG